MASLVSKEIIGGDTNLVDLIQETLERPAMLVDVTSLATKD